MCTCESTTGAMVSEGTPLPLGEAARSAGEGCVRDLAFAKNTHPSPQPLPRGRGGRLLTREGEQLATALFQVASQAHDRFGGGIAGAAHHQREAGQTGFA